MRLATFALQKHPLAAWTSSCHYGIRHTAGPIKTINLLRAVCLLYAFYSQLFPHCWFPNYFAGRILKGPATSLHLFTLATDCRHSEPLVKSAMAKEIIGLYHRGVEEGMRQPEPLTHHPEWNEKLTRMASLMASSPSSANMPVCYPKITPAAGTEISRVWKVPEGRIPRGISYSQISGLPGK